jgi:Flp pilus assembly protein TadD
LTADPRHLGALTRLGELQLALGNDDEAFENLIHLQHLKPNDPALFNLALDLYRRGEHERAARFFAALAAEDIHLQIKGLNMLGLTQTKLDRHDAAAAAYRQALVLDPTYAAARKNLAKTLIRQGNAPAGIAELKVVVSQYPDDVDSLYDLGFNGQFSGDVELAEQYYRRTLEIEPRHYRANVNMAKLLELRQDWRQAELYYRAADAARPGQEQVKAGLARAQTALSGK